MLLMMHEYLRSYPEMTLRYHRKRTKLLSLERLVPLQSARFTMGMDYWSLPGYILADVGDVTQSWHHRLIKRSTAQSHGDVNQGGITFWSL
jgi:hypothetical protein